MIILLDFDGVLITAPPWKKVELHADGFLEFNSTASANLMRLIRLTNAEIVLTTTHRINFSTDKWLQIFNDRGFDIKLISKVNDKTNISQMLERGVEIKEWTDHFTNSDYLILDDDASISTLPGHIQNRWIKTDSMTGFDDDAFKKALGILQIEK